MWKRVGTRSRAVVHQRAGLIKHGGGGDGTTPSQPPPMKLPWKHAARVADSFTLLSCVFYFGHPSPAASAAATAEPKWLQLSSFTSKPNGKTRFFTAEQLSGNCTGSWSLLSTEGQTAASTGSRGVAPVCPVVTLGRAGQGWTVPSSAVLRNAHVGHQSSGCVEGPFPATPARLLEALQEDGRAASGFTPD